MKPDNNRIIVHDTKCLHSMLIRPQGSSSPSLLFALRAIDLSTLISPPFPHAFGRAHHDWEVASLTPSLPRRTPTSASTLPCTATASAHSHQCQESTLQEDLCKTLQEVFQEEGSKKQCYARLGARIRTFSSWEIRTNRKINLPIIDKQPNFCLTEIWKQL